MAADQGLDVIGPGHLGQVAVEHQLGDTGGRVDRHLQHLGLGREQHAQLELLGSHLVGHGMGRLDEHLIGDHLGVGGQNRQAYGREDVEVVGLRGQVGVAVEMDGGQLHPTGKHHRSLAPGVGLIGEALHLLGGIGEGKMIGWAL